MGGEDTLLAASDGRTKSNTSADFFKTRCRVFGRLTEQAEHFGGGGNPPGALGQRWKLVRFCWEQPRGDELQEALHQLPETPGRQPDGQKELESNVW